jgi:thioredoxin reductase (NADPH)
VKVLWNTEVEEIKGDRQVRTVALKNNVTGEKSEVPVDAVFVQVGEAPNSQAAAGLETDETGYIKINLKQETNIPGVYAAGDVTTHPVKQVGTAVGQGITAALEAYGYIRRPYFKK